MHKDLGLYRSASAAILRGTTEQVNRYSFARLVRLIASEASSTARFGSNLAGRDRRRIFPDGLRQNYISDARIDSRFALK